MSTAPAPNARTRRRTVPTETLVQHSKSKSRKKNGGGNKACENCRGKKRRGTKKKRGFRGGLFNEPETPN